ncbi:Rieske 2Fe-2S domain-containing protein [Luedemannella flava]|uniref:Cytochrome bc1 complex Rieske iron-sulfur subunit n=1 Tax=Luedemannella flava TaxID=349316 RepID=A0ABP4Y8F5_9ACTN
MSGQHRPQGGTVHAIRLAFGISVLGAVEFAVAYGLGGNTQLLGVGLAVAFGGLCVGLWLWGRRLLPMGGFVEQRPPLAATQQDVTLLAHAIGGPESPVRRRGLLGMFALAVGTVGLALLFPARSLLSFRKPDPDVALDHTAWRFGGLRLVTPEGVPVRAADVGAETIQIVVPEGHTRDGDVPAFVVRVDPANLITPPPGGMVGGGLVAYSLLCTHAGCPVALYQQTTGRMLCPCHQSTFDLFNAATPVAGPAARPLPGLPIVVDADGYLRASGDFTSPPGPGYWSRP